MNASGTIISFYSFKGGVGRTMSLANIAVLLARKYKVLIIDFDIEAPGLNKFLANFKVRAGQKKGGLLDMFESYIESGPKSMVNYKPFIQSVTGSKIKSLHFLSSGKNDKTYSMRVQKFNWSQFFEVHHGTKYFEQFREDLKVNYDFILIDSRTGYSDTSGICTYFLPDVLVLLFTANDQSINGTTEVAEKAQIARQQLAFDRMPLTIFPIPSRIDKTVEYEEAKKWNEKFSTGFADYYKSWLPNDIQPRRLLEEITIPYLAYYSFGEKLPVEEDSLSSKESPAYYYNQIARILENNFQNIERILPDSRVDESNFGEGMLEHLINELKSELNNRQIAIIREVKSNRYVTNKWCRETFNVVNDTVNRDLKLLKNFKIIKTEGKGRSTRYIAGEKLFDMR